MAPQTEPWTRPVLRWAGSKRLLLPQLLALFRSTSGRYVEPFCGSACLFFALRPAHAVLADNNPHLIQLIQILARHPRALHLAVLKLRREDYYDIRAQDPHELNDLSRAARFMFLNRNCFNGVYRTNRRGEFNVPLGFDTGRIPNSKMFYRCSIALRRATIQCADFEATLRKARAGDVVYLDPPYDLGPRNRYGEYGYGSFGRGDIDRLAYEVKKLHRRGARFVLSYSNEPAFRQHFAEFNAIEMSVPRHVAGFAHARGRADEILITNLSRDVA